MKRSQVLEPLDEDFEVFRYHLQESGMAAYFTGPDVIRATRRWVRKGRPDLTSARLQAAKTQTIVLESQVASLVQEADRLQETISHEHRLAEQYEKQYDAMRRRYKGAEQEISTFVHLSFWRRLVFLFGRWPKAV